MSTVTTNHGRTIDVGGCHYCHRPVSPNDPSVWRRVSGWERKAIGPQRRGGSDIALREQGHEVACHACILKLRSGVSPAQSQLPTGAA